MSKLKYADTESGQLLILLAFVVGISFGFNIGYRFHKQRVQHQAVQAGAAKLTDGELEWIVR